MTTFPKHIQQAVDLGLLVAEDNRIVGVGSEESETILGLSRLMEKIQPTLGSEEDDTQDQEAIVLCRILTSPSGLARELWSELRIAVGVGHGQKLPQQLWSTDTFKAIGGLIDDIFNGEADASLISKDTLIAAFPTCKSKFVSMLEFNQTVTELSQQQTMAAYGDGASEWGVAIDLLRRQRAKANFVSAQKIADKAVSSDTKLEKAIEEQQQQLMTCLGMLRGSVGNQGNAVDAVEELFQARNGKESFIDQIMNARAQSQPVSTGIESMDIDMEGGVRRPGESQGGRLFTLAARTGVGKTVLGVYAAVNLAVGGLTVGFVSAELDKSAIYARIWSAATKVANDNRGGWVRVGDIESPNDSRETVGMNITAAAGVIQNAGGKLLIEDPWGADVDSVINSLRSMKAKNPEMRCAVIDHFHVLARHKGAPTSEAAMLEERAYKLMNCAKQLEIDLIVLAQMNRIGMDSVKKEEAPTLDQIRGTDALSHVSHAVWIVRRETGDANQSAEEKKKRPLELWHAKTRGRQARWNGKQMVGLNGFVDKSIIRMNYAYCSVEQDLTLLT